MAIDPDFLRRVQGAGWVMIALDADSVICACPRDGCALRVRLGPGKSIPQTCSRGPDLIETIVDSYETGRLFLRERREGLGLAIKDVEEIAGLATDHLAKMEKDDPSRLPNVETFILWVQALGYEVVIRPGRMTPFAMRLMVKTAEKLSQLRTKFRIHAGRRQQRP